MERDTSDTFWPSAFRTVSGLGSVSAWMRQGESGDWAPVQNLSPQMPHLFLHLREVQCGLAQIQQPFAGAPHTLAALATGANEAMLVTVANEETVCGDASQTATDSRNACVSGQSTSFPVRKSACIMLLTISTLFDRLSGSFSARSRSWHLSSSAPASACVEGRRPSRSSTS